MTRLTIGLVNIMPDSGLRATERQFRQLLAQAAPQVEIALRLFCFHDHARSDTALAYLRQHYVDVEQLWLGDAIDGLIVTGTEPRSSTLEDEPFWPGLTRLLAWASEHTTSTILSCLAAHAGVLCFDGIKRVELVHKLCGVYDCARVTAHPLLEGISPTWVMPHSRFNDLTEAALVARGYAILSRSPQAGVDLFAAERKSLFLFMQGHPEYDAGALLREYRRDIGRFLAGERDEYPVLPSGYLDASAAARCAAFEMRAMRARDIRVLAEFPEADREARVAQPWRRPALMLYGNWLSYLAGRGQMPHRGAASALTATR